MNLHNLNIEKNFIKILDREANNRIGNNFIYREYKNSGILNIYPSVYRGTERKFYSIGAWKSGRVEDIKINNLKKLMALLGKRIEPDVEAGCLANAKIENNKNKKEAVCYLKVLLGDKIVAGEVLFEIDKSIIEKEDLKVIEKISQNIFIIKEEDLEGEARMEILKLKDRCILAIDNRCSRNLKKAIWLYVDLVNDFFKYFEKHYGNCFSAKQARQE